NGFIGQPREARKTMGEQFFFVNNRYMRHPFFNKAVMQAYEKILPPDTYPSYFLFFEVDPSSIDINIHPTKTEIKFENEQAIWQIIVAALRESLGRFNVVPSIDFDQKGSIEIPLPPKPGDLIEPPHIHVDPGYNPFNQERSGGSSFQSPWKRNELVSQWEQLYSFPEKEDVEVQIQINHEESPVPSVSTFMQLKNRYILSPVKSGLMIIDQKRAHERILFERFLNIIEERPLDGQQLLYPQTIDLESSDATLLTDLLPDLHYMGFDIRSFGPNSFVIGGVPAEVEIGDCKSFIDALLEDVKSKVIDLKGKLKEDLALEIACFSAVDYGKTLSNEEIRVLIDSLFACKSPNFSPSGKSVLSIIPLEEFDKRLK
ncbi:MAG: DNA mismatch repair protein MutL, partial [Bacteroidota bacterium]|nr:DNA mismatch repair protein MutL [Bacteroidota bacterium]